MTLLDIGAGWGGLAEHAARNYGVEVTGITVSKEQASLAAERCKGLPINFVLQDYRQLTGSYDRLVSVGMFEHVGQKNYATYMDKCQSLLKKDGLFLLHTIGTNRTHELVDPWIKKYIFPNGKLPSIRQLTDAWEPHFVLEDLHSFGPDYDRTLMAWHDNFESRYHEIAGVVKINCGKWCFRSRLRKDATTVRDSYYLPLPQIVCGTVQNCRVFSTP